jgi:Sulfotransferase domain
MSFPIVALWSHPRSMSTAFERIMRARGDMQCLHEPFMYDYYINRSTRQMPHFEAMEEHPKSYAEIRAMILEKADRGPVFFKDMSYYVMPHIAGDNAFFRRITHSFLIRDPKASIVSYAKLDPDMLREEIGIEAQWLHAEAVMKQLGLSPVVMKSEQLQADPEGQMRKYWRAVGLPNKPEALHWQDPAPEDWQQVQGWHQDVISSSTIRPITTDQVARAEAEFRHLAAAQPRYADYLAHHLPYYTGLARFAL